MYLKARLKPGFARNSIMSGLQAIVTVLVMFLAYRIFLSKFGVESMGLWSILLAVTSIVRIGDMTGAAGLSRFVAQAEGDGRDASVYIHTLTLATLVLYSALAIGFMLFSDKLLATLLEADQVASGRDLLLVAVIGGVILTPLGALLSSAIDGARRADLRAILVMVSYIAFILSFWILSNSLGLKAWGLALIVQQVIVIVGAWIVLARTVVGVGVCPYKFSTYVLRETVPYGMKLTLNSIAGTLSDPVIKLLLNHHSGLQSVGLYDVAMRLILAFRNVLVQMAMPLVPEFARAQGDSGQLQVLITKGKKMAVWGSVCFVFLVLISSPIYSVIMLNEINRDLLMIVGIMVLGYSVNMLALPMYLIGFGLNIMRWNVGSQFVMAICVGLIGSLLGPYYGETGIMLSVLCGLLLGALMVMYGNANSVAR